MLKLWDGDAPRAVIDACPDVQALDSSTLMLVAQRVLGFLSNTERKDELKSLGRGCVLWVFNDSDARRWRGTPQLLARWQRLFPFCPWVPLSIAD